MRLKINFTCLSQTLQFFRFCLISGQSNFENVLQGSTVKDVVDQIESKEKMSIKKVEIVAQKVDQKAKDVKVSTKVIKTLKTIFFT